MKYKNIIIRSIVFKNHIFTFLGNFRGNFTKKENRNKFLSVIIEIMKSPPSTMINVGYREIFFEHL